MPLLAPGKTRDPGPRLRERSCRVAIKEEDVFHCSARDSSGPQARCQIQLSKLSPCWVGCRERPLLREADYSKGDRKIRGISDKRGLAPACRPHDPGRDADYRSEE